MLSPKILSMATVWAALAWTALAGEGIVIGGTSERTYYAGVVQKRLQSALQETSLRDAVFSATAKVWLDPAGKVTKVEITGEKEAMAQKLSDVLKATSFQPPPLGLPLPIVLRLQARRPPGESGPDTQLPKPRR